MLSIIGYHLMLYLCSKFINQSKEVPAMHTVITGASKGLGKYLAYECAKLKHDLVLVSLPKEGLIEFGKELVQDYHCSVKCYELDLTNREDLITMAEDIKMNYPINVLINNAGFGGTKSFAEVTSTYLDKMINLNVSAPVILTRMLIEHLAKHKPAYILNIASLASFSPMPFKTAYPATKTFLWSFSRGLYQEYKKQGVFVSVAHPGGMATNYDVSERIKKQPKLIRNMMLSPENTATILIKQLFKKDSLILPGLYNKINWLFIQIISCMVEVKTIRTKSQT